MMYLDIGINLLDILVSTNYNNTNNIHIMRQQFLLFIYIVNNLQLDNKLW